MRDPGRLDTQIMVIFEGHLPPNCVGEQISEDRYQVGPVWASNEKLSSREFWAAQQVTGESISKMTIRHMDGIKENHTRVRIISDGTEHDVIRVYPVGRRHQIELTVRCRS